MDPSYYCARGELANRRWDKKVPTLVLRLIKLHLPYVRRCIEHMYRRAFGGDKGLLDARVGYMGGDTQNPSYRAVCSGRTGRTS